MPRGAIVFFALLLFVGCSFDGETTTAEKGLPNIILFLVDDLGWSDLGVQGNEWYPTPRIDALAKEGMRFITAYAPAPVCSPSRAGMMSGVSPARLGMTDFIPGHWRPYEELYVPTNRTQYLPLERQTYAEALKQQDYATAYFGKWHLGWGEYVPGNQGFDTVGVQGGWGHFFPVNRFTPAYPVDSGAYLTDVITQRGLDFIDDMRDTNFLLVISHFAVHIPLEAPQELIDEAAAAPQPADRVYNPTYVAMLKSVDDNLGRVVDKLKALGLSDNTLLVFTSDNGGLRQIFNKSSDEIVTENTPLRDEKGSLYEGGIRVPFIMHWPGRIPASTISEEPVTGLDLYPTFLDVAGLSLPEFLAGESLVPLWEEGGDLDREAIFFHYPHYHHSRPAASMLWQERYKLIRYFDQEEPELYDLVNDLGETKNLAADQPDLAADLLVRLDDWLAETEADLPRENPDFDPARREEWGSRPK